MNSSSSTSKKQIGFTLIEISIVMIIVGLMVVGFIQSYKIYDEKRKIELTELRLNDIEQAINNYALINGRLPCPAARNVPGATYDSGKAVDCATAIPPGVINVPGQDVLIGLLPTYDLGISHGSSRDSHNYAFTYAVTRSLADGTATGAGGAITVNEEYFEDVNASPDVQDIQRKTQSYPDVQYVVLSAGETGAGAYAYDGAPLYGGTGPYACQGADTTDGENCDDDHIFTDSRAANEFYDDRVRYKRLLPVLTASNDSGCEQYDTITLTSNSCPEGWEKIDNSILPFTPRLSGGSGFGGERRGEASIETETSAGITGENLFYNFDSETNDYYVSAFRTNDTVDDITYDGSKSVCSKAPTNVSPTKCFADQIEVPYRRNNAGRHPTVTYNNPSSTNPVDYCPDGYRAIKKSSGPNWQVSWESGGGAMGEDHHTALTTTETIVCAR